MANYKERSVQGVSWKRCNSIQITNPHISTNRPIRATFLEEEIVDVGNSTFLITSSSFYKPLNVDVNPSATFDIYNPTTGEKVEGQTMTHAELYSLLYSAYRTEAEKRDILLESANPIANT